MWGKVKEEKEEEDEDEEEECLYELWLAERGILS